IRACRPAQNQPGRSPLAARKKQADNGHDDLGGQRRHHLAHGATHDDGDRERENVVLEQKFLKSFEQWKPPNRLRIPSRTSMRAPSTRFGGIVLARPPAGQAWPWHRTQSGWGFRKSR